ncbi:MAG: efflux RND transporter periplasmic adaptor subunit [Hyphomicrobiaceae bacterium]
MCRNKKAKTIISSITAGVLTFGVALPLQILVAPEASAQNQTLRKQSTGKKDDGKSVKYTCPMHPHYIADEMGTCPICGMDLVKLDQSDASSGPTSSGQRAQVTVSAEVMQNMGVRIAQVERANFGRSIRSYGIVEENERLQTELTARLEGWVEELKVTAVGDKIKKGDVLFRLYSPELVVSQRDYIAARDRTRKQNIQQRLRAFGVQSQVIRRLERTGKVEQNIPFYADRDGTVSELMLKEGTYVKRGMMMVKVQDYNSVWLSVGVAEQDLPFVTKGTPTAVSFPSMPDREIAGKVDYIYPTVDPKTRTGRVRLVIDNKDGLIRPGSYADVKFQIGADQRLAVPSEAILKSEIGEYVVVSLGEGVFAPRMIKTGVRSGRWTEVAKGIKSDESIVVSGQFLLDSESALRESFRKLERLQLPFDLIKLDSSQIAMFDHLVDAALYLHEAMVDGYDPDAKFLQPAVEIKKFMWPAFRHTKLAFVMTGAQDAIKKAQKAETESEMQSALDELVASLKPWMLEGAPGHYAEKKVALFKDEGSGRHWLQMKGKPVNPYGNGAAAIMPWPEPRPKNMSVAEPKAESEAEKEAPMSMPGHNHGG